MKNKIIYNTMITNTDKQEAIEKIDEAADKASAVLEKAASIAANLLDNATKFTEAATSLIVQDVMYIKADVKEIKEKLDTRYVTKEEFKWVRNVVYGLVALILYSVFKKLL